MPPAVATKFGAVACASPDMSSSSSYCARACSKPRDDMWDHEDDQTSLLPPFEPSRSSACSSLVHSRTRPVQNRLPNLWARRQAKNPTGTAGIAVADIIDGAAKVPRPDPFRCGRSEVLLPYAA